MALRSGAMLFSVLCIVIWWWMAQRSTLAQITASPTPCRPALAYCAGTTLRRSVNDDVQAAIDNTQAVRYTGCTQNRMVTVAQLGRALDCGSSGCGFEPHRSPFISSQVQPCDRYQNGMSIPYAFCSPTAFPSLFACSDAVVNGCNHPGWGFQPMASTSGDLSVSNVTTLTDALSIHRERARPASRPR